MTKNSNAKYIKATPKKINKMTYIIVAGGALG